MKQRPDISIVCVTWNRKKFLELGLPSLFEALSPDLSHEIIFWDNASTDGTLDLLQQSLKSTMTSSNFRKRSIGSPSTISKSFRIMDILRLIRSSTN